MVVVIDNYDSFTYNLVQYLGELGASVTVMRNDAVTVEAMAPRPARSHRHFSGAGPPRGGRRDDGGDSTAWAARRRSSASVWGIRRSARSSAASVVRAPAPMHGKTSTIEHDGRGVFSGLDGPFVASRYHSLVVVGRGTCRRTSR